MQLMLAEDTLNSHYHISVDVLAMINFLKIERFRFSEFKELKGLFNKILYQCLQTMMTIDWVFFVLKRGLFFLIFVCIPFF